MTRIEMRDGQWWVRTERRPSFPARAGYNRCTEAIAGFWAEAHRRRMWHFREWARARGYGCVIHEVFVFPERHHVAWNTEPTP